MKIKKRILSAFILLSVLGTGVYLGVKENETALQSVQSDDILSEMDEQNEDVLKSEANGDALTVYNNYLKEQLNSNIVLSTEDIEFMADLVMYATEKNVAAVESECTGHFITFSLDEDADDYIMQNENRSISLCKVLDSRKVYCDVRMDIYSSELLEDGDMEKMIPVGEFIDNHGMEIDGYCIPTFDALSGISNVDVMNTIKAVYGKEVLECVQLFGLPVPYYKSQNFYDAQKKMPTPVKGLNN